MSLAPRRPDSRTVEPGFSGDLPPRRSRRTCDSEEKHRDTLRPGSRTGITGRRCRSREMKRQKAKTQRPRIGDRQAGCQLTASRLPAYWLAGEPPRRRFAGPDFSPAPRRLALSPAAKSRNSVASRPTDLAGRESSPSVETRSPVHGLEFNTAGPVRSYPQRSESKVTFDTRMRSAPNRGSSSLTRPRMLIRRPRNVSRSIPI